jgi:hypothetical protein
MYENIISAVLKILAVLFVIVLSKTESIMKITVCLLFALALFYFSSSFEGVKK